MSTIRNRGLQAFAYSASVTGFLAFALFAIVMGGIGLATGQDQVTYVAVATIAFLIPLGAGVMRKGPFDPFEPINLVALAIFFGTTLRAFWLSLSSSDRVDFIMMGTSYESVLNNAPLIIAAIVVLTLGYVVTAVRFPIEKLGVIRNYALDRRRVWVAVLLASTVAAVGLALLINSFGVDFSSGFGTQSMKRVHEYVGEDGSIVYGSGSERFLAGMASHAVLLLGSLMVLKLLPANLHNLAFLGGVAFMAILGPFLTSSRSTIVLLIIHLAIFLFYYGRLKVRTVLIGGAAAIFILVTLGAIRETNQTDVERDMTAIDRVVGSGNSLDFVRTSAIMDRVPETSPYLAGDSYLALLAAPIPRSMWLDKPQISLGRYVKSEVFGEDVRAGGWPSGLVAEGWMNFGWLGLILPLFLFGALLRTVYETCRPLLGVSFPVTLLYSVMIWRLGFGTIGLNFAQGITQTLFYLAPMLVLLLIARAPAPRTARPAYG